MHLLRSLGTIAIVTLLATGCSSGEVEAIPGGTKDTAYCQLLVRMPAGLQEAVGSAASGNASDTDKKVIADTAKQLRTAAAANGAPADLQQTLTNSATLLDNLSTGKVLSASDATTFDNLGKAVNTACTA